MGELVWEDLVLDVRGFGPGFGFPAVARISVEIAVLLDCDSEKLLLTGGVLAVLLLLFSSLVGGLGKLHAKFSQWRGRGPPTLFFRLDDSPVVERPSF